ncbi:MFS domain-containing protein [Mycena indigotica]|uniref:MFS domain-containing protein n=1 Tax=Mycena indigotica TaxID=2126181 RepID=A0A8H6WBV8_9AGAR|nr:MFS domain-containing protein [Mycena indigotica]KAF7306729.1 MFS domain-containing protein [Mycena indigotica]
MSLQPIALDLCQASTLRGRRRSSIRPQAILPALGYASGATRDESALADDVECHIDHPTTAHTSSHSSSFTTSRHQDDLTLSSPKTTSTVTTVNCESYFEAKCRPGDLRLKWRLASALFQYFLNGWGDGVTGTALPYFRAQFHLSYMTSSLLFAGTMCGFTLGTLFVPRIIAFLGRFYFSHQNLALQPLSPFRSIFSRSRLGPMGFSLSQARFLALIITSFASPVNFILMGSKRGLAVMFIAYVIISFGRAISTAPLNLFLSEMPSKPLGYAFGLWGIGAVVSPLIFQATAAAGLPWNHFYFGSLVLAAANTTFLAITFMPTAQELETDRKKALAQVTSQPLDAKNDTTSKSVKNPLRLIAVMPYQWAVSVFTLFYCGTETTIQGLVVQYLLAERKADPDTVGYVTSGFWLGISISRVGWSYFSPSASTPCRSACVGLAMLFLIWFIDSIIENGASVGLIGLFFGPIFPALLELANDLLPAEVHLVSMAIISAAGSVGSAILPFVTGVITTEYTMNKWPYITVALTSSLFVVWYLFPTHQPVVRALRQN